MRRMILAFPLAAGSLVLAALVAGCGTDSGDPDTNWTEPTASKAADPVTAVKQAMDRSLAGSITIKASVTARGVSVELSGEADPAAKVMQVSGKAPEPIEARVIGETAYIKLDSLEGDKPWTKIDLNKLKKDSQLRQSFDLKAQTGIVGGIITAEEVGDGRYRGTADLAKAAEAASTDGGMRDSLESTAKLAKDPKAIPFEATVDAEGRVTELSYTIATTSMGDIATDVQFSGFGEPVKVTPPPAGQTQVAPEEMYAFL